MPDAGTAPLYQLWNLWMTDSEMQVHRDAKENGHTLPPIWNQLCSLIREEYCRMAEVFKKDLGGRARTVGGCDEFRHDMLRHAICLLKYYGFTYSEPSYISHHYKANPEAKTVYFCYNLFNPTWEHLEEEIRDDLKSTGFPEDQIPPHYPDTPTSPPSSSTNYESIEELCTVSALGEALLRNKGEENRRPFF